MAQPGIWPGDVYASLADSGLKWRAWKPSMQSSFLPSAVLPRLRLRPLQLRDCLFRLWLADCFRRFLSAQCSDACQSFSMGYLSSGKPKSITTVLVHARFGSIQTFERAIAKRARMHLSCSYLLYHTLDNILVQGLMKPTRFAREQCVQVSQQKVCNADELSYLQIDCNESSDVL